MNIIEIGNKHFKDTGETMQELLLDIVLKIRLRSGHLAKKICGMTGMEI